MIIEETIRQAYTRAMNYPDLAQKLADCGVQSYTVEVSSGIIQYRLADGETLFHPGLSVACSISPAFDQAGTVTAIWENQQQKTDYTEFMEAIAQAGVRFYDAILTGPNKRVIYLGVGGCYEETIPIA